MPDLHTSPGFLAWLCLTFVAAGLVKGVTGMGLPTVAMGLLGAAMPPVAAAALLVIPSLVTNLWQLAVGPAEGPLLRRLWPMLLGSVLGTWAASALLARADPRWTGLALGLALMGYAAYALMARPLSVPRCAESWLSPAVGLTTGAITGATGVFVMPAVPYLQALRLERDELVQALGLSFTVSTLALAAGLAGHGALPVQQMGWSTLATLPALAGMWLGQRLRERISPQRFRQGFLWFLLLLGLELASRTLR
ncbi:MULTISPECIES: sulfite exporter TauE/SafE family protein [unclassified Acidovorax]|uniref:sulfite exporter TauE/SafE family protein n=1 Tax=unclassified Acidovorax TaxID=2684926 RepID=UPI00288300A7|nr:MULTISPECIES: sulfite exporter TauE/SafE family protein [unclassified Acidovorax]